MAETLLLTSNDTRCEVDGGRYVSYRSRGQPLHDWLRWPKSAIAHRYYRYPFYPSLSHYLSWCHYYWPSRQSRPARMTRHFCRSYSLVCSLVSFKRYWSWYWPPIALCCDSDGMQSNIFWPQKSNYITSPMCPYGDRCFRADQSAFGNWW